MYKLVVLFSMLVLVTAFPSGLASWGLEGHRWGAPLLGTLHTPVAAPVVADASALHSYNYRGPLSLAPGQPAKILAADGRPLDTLRVNVDRAVHLTVKALDPAGLHHLGKRSAPLLASLAAAWSPSTRVDIPADRWPLAVPAVGHLRAPAAPLALGAWDHGAPLAHW